MLSFKPAFLLSSFNLSKTLFSSFSLYDMSVVSSTYLNLFIFLPALLIPACDSSSPAFHIMYSAYKLNKQGDNIQPWHTPFHFEPVHCSMSGSNFCTLACIKVSQEAAKVVWYFHLFENFPQFAAIHTIKRFNIVNEADVFLEFHCFLCDPTNFGNLIFGSSASLNPSLYIWKFLVYVLSKLSLKDFEYYFASMWNEYNCMVMWIFLGIAFLWDWNENWPFPVLWPLLSFSNSPTYWVQHFNSIIF